MAPSLLAASLPRGACLSNQSSFKLVFQLLVLACANNWYSFTFSRDGEELNIGKGKDGEEVPGVGLRRSSVLKKAN
jgi:hypothetical protein